MSVSGYVHRGRVKYSAPAFHKTTTYKGHSRNHLLDQVESFRIGAKDSKREDDLLDAFCYGIAMALGSGLIDHSQNMTVAAMQIAEK